MPSDTSDFAALINALLGLIPERHRATVAMVLAAIVAIIQLVMVLGRIWQGYKTGGSLFAAIGGVIKGTNLPSSMRDIARLGTLLEQPFPPVPAVTPSAPSTAHISEPPVPPDAGGVTNPPTSKP